MFAIRTALIPLIAALGLSVAGCIVENEHSIVDQPAPFDKRLPGVWALEADGEAQLLVLRAEEGNDDRLDARFIITEKDDPPQTSRATVAFTTIGDRPYFEANWKAGEWLPIDPPVRRAFGMFEIAGSANEETLRICFADSESFEEPLKSGALAGFSGTGKEYERRIIVASEQAALRAYLAKSHFKCSLPSTFRRLTGPEQSR